MINKILEWLELLIESYAAILNWVKLIQNNGHTRSEQIVSSMVFNGGSGRCRTPFCSHMNGYNPGSWETHDGHKTRDIPAVNINRVPRIAQKQYCIRDGIDMLANYEWPTVLRKAPHNIQLLARYSGNAVDWPLPKWSTISWPLYIHYKTCLSMGQFCVASRIKQLAQKSVSMWNRFIMIMCKRRTERQRKRVFSGFVDVSQSSGSGETFTLYFDDFVRHFFKCVSSNCYIATFKQGPAYMLMTHLHALTAKSPYLKTQIIEDIEDWVSDSSDGTKKHIDSDSFNQTLDTVFGAWTPPIRSALSFEQYATDVFRWATSGGAPPVVIANEKIKSKWAWGVAKSFDRNGHFDGGSRILHAIRESEHCDAVVALKEEPQKTREIISTPIGSYIRQSYLLYRWGKPKIESPISTSSWITLFERGSYEWYGCIDGERFDQTIPADAIIEIIRRLGTLDDETRIVADAEIASLRSLHVSWGSKRWKWRGGLLSGWRITSLAGSLISLAAASYILKSLHLEATCRVGVMGDDVVMYSNTQHIDIETLAAYYTRFGLKANPSKTLAGPVGEFLRKVRSQLGSIGFPALGLRSVCYASPWVTNYKFDREQECSGNWLIYLSRMIAHSIDHQVLFSYIYGLIGSVLQLDFKNLNWADWLLTPISAGGGGAIECVGMRWKMMTTVDLERDRPRRAYDYVTSLVGVGTKQLVSLRRLKYVNPSIVFRDYDPDLILARGSGIGFKYDVNITSAICEIIDSNLYGSQITHLIDNPISYAARSLRGVELVQYIMSEKEERSGFTSILSTKEGSSGITMIVEGMTNLYLSSRRMSAYDRPAAKTIILMNYYKFNHIPYGTW